MKTLFSDFVVALFNMSCLSCKRVSISQVDIWGSEKGQHGSNGGHEDGPNATLERCMVALNVYLPVLPNLGIHRWCRTSSQKSQDEPSRLSLLLLPILFFSYWLWSLPTLPQITNIFLIPKDVDMASYKLSTFFPHALSPANQQKPNNLKPSATYFQPLPSNCWQHIGEEKHLG